MNKFSFLGAVAAGALMVAGGSAPTFAKDAPKDVISEAASAPIIAAKNAMDKKDFAEALVQLDKAEPLVKSPYDKFIVGQFRAISASNVKDEKNITMGLDEAIDSGYSSDLLSKYTLLSGQRAYSAGDYSKSLIRFTKAQELGNPEPNLALLIADSYFKLGKTPEGLAVLDKAVANDEAAHRPTSEDLFGRAVSAANNAKMYQESDNWMVRLVKASPTKSNWHDLLGNYLGNHKLSYQAMLDVFRLMRASKSFHEAKEIGGYASLANDIKHNPAEAKAAIDEGKASGLITQMSQGMRETYASASAKVASDRAGLRSTAATANIAQGNGDGYFGFAEYPQAISLYKTALAKGGLDANALNMRIGMAQALSGNKADAKASFALVGGDEAEIAKFWTLWLNQN